MLLYNKLKTMSWDFEYVNLPFLDRGIDVRAFINLKIRCLCFQCHNMRSLVEIYARVQIKSF